MSQSWLAVTIRRNLIRFRGQEVKTTGDGVLATFDGPAEVGGGRRRRSACKSEFSGIVSMVLEEGGERYGGHPPTAWHNPLIFWQKTC